MSTCAARVACQTSDLRSMAGPQTLAQVAAGSGAAAVSPAPARANAPPWAIRASQCSPLARVASSDPEATSPSWRAM
eukprot:4487410-Alexandrium_andersonii.AAC.1